MDKKINTLRELFSSLQSIQDHTWLRKTHRAIGQPSTTALDTYERIKDIYKPIGQREITDFLSPGINVDMDFSRIKRYLFLPPLKKEAIFVPVFTGKCQIDRDTHSAKYRVMLISFNKLEGKLNGLGFRIESPEGNNNPENPEIPNTGSHNFYHAQLIKNFSKDQESLSIDWLPDSQPSFPIIADCPITMLICLLVSLYGKQYTNKILQFVPINEMQKYIKKLNPIF